MRQIGHLPVGLSVAEARRAPDVRIQIGDDAQRPRVQGKFLVLGGEKFFVRGVTYGAFPPNADGHQFPDPPEVAKDLGLMREAGINTLLTYTVPPLSLLDQAQEHGIRVIVNIPWMGHVCFLEQASTRRRIRQEVRDAVASCRRHPAVLMHAVAKELPPQIIRWYGKKRVEAFLRDLYHVAKDEDPTALVTYTNFPTTEYLELPFLDVQTFNVYLHQRSQFCAYLSRLQHLAGESPLVLTELGMCSLRHGEAGQARFLDWQIEEAYDHGLAGTVVFGWTDPFFQDGCLVDEWGFGLVDAARRPKPSYDVVSRRFQGGVPFHPERRWPKVSVVVALYNAAKTLDDCLSSLEKLDYPDYEVIVVDDGSTDESPSIIERYPFRSFRTQNRGVSAARNLGLEASTGEIVAYIDSDARADRDWLRFLVATFLENDVAGVGGPNLVPPEDGWIAKCVYRAPGGPTQVMLDDRWAEHIPGCNMAFWKRALEEVGGFDPIFTAAGDDVDVCWRLLERGWRLGFSPSAVVWHHRRPSARAYWRQQVGYGRAEAILERKHPNKFNPWGHTFWAGQIYAPYPSFRLFGRPRIYQGLWGSAGFQSMYSRGGEGALSFLPRALEWHVILAALVVVGLFFPWALALSALGFAYNVFYCVSCARAANLNALTAPEGGGWLERWRWRAEIAWLHFLEPLARAWGRIRGGLTPWRSVHRPAEVRPASRWWQRVHPFRRSVQWVRRGGIRLEKNQFLERLTETLRTRRCAVGWNPDYEGWDLKVRRGALGEATLRAVVEHHGGPRRLLRVSASLAPSRGVAWALVALSAVAGAAAASGHLLPLVGVLGMLSVLWVGPIVEAGRIEAGVREAMEEVCVSLADEEPAAFREAYPAQSESRA